MRKTNKFCQYRGQVRRTESRQGEKTRKICKSFLMKLLTKVRRTKSLHPFFLFGERWLLSRSSANAIRRLARQLQSACRSSKTVELLVWSFTAIATKIWHQKICLTVYFGRNSFYWPVATKKIKAFRRKRFNLEIKRSKKAHCSPNRAFAG